MGVYRTVGAARRHTATVLAVETADVLLQRGVGNTARSLRDGPVGVGALTLHEEDGTAVKRLLGGLNRGGAGDGEEGNEGGGDGELHFDGGFFLWRERLQKFLVFFLEKVDGLTKECIVEEMNVRPAVR